MKAFLDHFAAILGALTVTLLALSISHEYGYFLLIGRNFQTLLTTSDYLANSVLWLPLALMFVFGMEWEKLNYKAPETKRNWKNWKTWIVPGIVGGGVYLFCECRYLASVAVIHDIFCGRDNFCLVAIVGVLA